MTWLTPELVDLAALGLLALSVAVGAFRGVTLELMSLAGWVVAWFGAQWLVPWLAPWLPVGERGSALNHGAAFACSFLLILIVWGLLSRLVSMLVRATPLSALDRLFGALFGLARGVLVLLVVATLVSWTPARTSNAWRTSTVGPVLDVAVAQVRAWLTDPST